MFFSGADLRAADPFQDKVLPFLKTYCVQCHNAKKKSGELDLTRFTSAAKSSRTSGSGNIVVTFLKKEEMPPAKAKQPPAALRAEILATLEKVLLDGGAQAGGRSRGGAAAPAQQRRVQLHHPRPDRRRHPAGGVVPRRSRLGRGLQQHRRSPDDVAEPVQEILCRRRARRRPRPADDVGLAVRPVSGVTFADRQKFYEQAILRFYEQHEVDYEKYLTALWLYRHRPAAGRRPRSRSGPRRTT